MGEETDLVLAFVVADNEEILRHEVEQARLVWESRREGEGGNLPTKSRLLTSAPNPFNPRTAIRFALPWEEKVRMDIYDLRGRHVRSLLDETRASGFHRVIWEGVDGDGSPVASGVYRVLLRTPTVEQSSALTLVR